MEIGRRIALTDALTLQDDFARLAELAPVEFRVLHHRPGGALHLHLVHVAPRQVHDLDLDRKEKKTRRLVD